MIVFDVSTIFGVSLGFEIADGEVREMAGLNWGFAIDFFIIRFQVSNIKEE